MRKKKELIVLKKYITIGLIKSDIVQLEYIHMHIMFINNRLNKF